MATVDLAGGGEATYTSKGVPFRGRLRPVSRGQPCVVHEGSYDGPGQDRPYPRGKCAVTDGQLMRSPGVSGVRCQSSYASCPDQWVVIDLGREVPVTGVAVHPPDERTVEAGTDQREWREIGRAAPGDTSVALVATEPVTARYVRVRGTADPADIGEVEVFAG